MKSIVLGNAPSVLFNEFGDKVDTFDNIIRMNMYEIEGYEFKHYISTVSKSRSLSLCIRDSLCIIDDGLVGPEKLKCQFVKINTPDMGKIIVYNVYIPPENSIEFPLCKAFISLLSDHIKRVRREGFKIFVCGDFNSYNPAFGKYPQENFSNPRVILENDFVAEMANENRK